MMTSPALETRMPELVLSSHRLTILEVEMHGDQVLQLEETILVQVKLGKVFFLNILMRSFPGRDIDGGLWLAEIYAPWLNIARFPLTPCDSFPACYT
jgi:hypothetical protein